jgi:manganese efflux pump family protein
LFVTGLFVHDITLFVTAAALGADAFAVSAGVAAGLDDVSERHTFRLIWHFGLFQSLMTLVGWAGGEGLSSLLFGLNHWIAAGILFFLGVKMVWESGDAEEEAKAYDPTRGWSLMGLSVATSLDAMAVGVSFSLMSVSIWRPALLIGLVALVMTFIGMSLGKRAGAAMGRWAERAGGCVLVGIGLRILHEHVWG